MALLYPEKPPARTRRLNPVYPPGAPLPKFKITSAKGYLYLDSGGNPYFIGLKFTGVLLNYQEIKNLFSAYPWFQMTVHIGDSFGGIQVASADGSFTTPWEWFYFTEDMIKWTTLAFTSSGDGVSSSYTFTIPAYFCDVYIPNPSTLTPYVWTDLQFRQAQGAPSLKLVAGVATLGLLGLAYAYHKRKRS